MRDHFDILAPIYDRVIGPPSPERLRDLLRLPADGWLLDAGGGTGRIARLLRPLVDHLVISDQSRPMLRQARGKTVDALVQTPVERLPFPDGAFARVLVVDALHHFADQPASIGELLRVLAPGGRLVIEEPDIERPVVKLVALAERLAGMGSTFNRPEAIQAMVAAHGRTARVERDGQFAAWIIVDR